MSNIPSYREVALIEAMNGNCRLPFIRKQETSATLPDAMS
jgi:hypothetical protein